MKKSEALYLSAREASAELAISPATLYAYVSRGLIRSEPSPDSRSHRYRAEDIRGLKERRVPSVEPRGFKSFDPDLPVMDSAICDHHRGRRDLSRRELRRSRRKGHAGACRDAAVGRDRRRSVCAGQLPAMSPTRCAPLPRPRAAPRRSTAPSPCWRWRPAPIPARSRARRKAARWSARASCGCWSRPCSTPTPSAEPLHLQIAQGLGARQQARARPDPPRAGAARRSRVERLDLHRALRGVDRPQSLRLRSSPASRR